MAEKVKEADKSEQVSELEQLKARVDNLENYCAFLRSFVVRCSEVEFHESQVKYYCALTDIPWNIGEVRRISKEFESTIKKKKEFDTLRDDGKGPLVKALCKATGMFPWENN